mmetsp:Transcript_7583/g.15408  ORF Transcript_7583/g.15408 Transcript_7583/m.15408 type:complete len:769 (-) Transcript_7583:1038-3344(-)
MGSSLSVESVGLSESSPLGRFVEGGRGRLSIANGLFWQALCLEFAGIVRTLHEAVDGGDEGRASKIAEEVDGAVATLTRALVEESSSGMDPVSYNVSVLARYMGRRIRRFGEGSLGTCTTVLDQDDETALWGGIMLLRTVLATMVQTGAHSAQVAAVLGASVEMETSPAMVHRGVVVGNSVVHAAMDCIVALESRYSSTNGRDPSHGRYAEIAIALVDLVLVCTSSQLYSDLIVPRGRLPFASALDSYPQQDGFLRALLRLLELGSEGRSLMNAEEHAPKHAEWAPGWHGEEGGGYLQLDPLRMVELIRQRLFRQRPSLSPFQSKGSSSDLAKIASTVMREEEVEQEQRFRRLSGTLGEQCLLLVLVLCVPTHNDSMTFRRAFRGYLQSCSRGDLSILLDAIGYWLWDERGSFLLYLVLSSSSEMEKFLLESETTRSLPNRLLYPLLRLTFHICDGLPVHSKDYGKSESAYLSLVVLVTLTRNETFSKTFCKLKSSVADLKRWLLLSSEDEEMSLAEDTELSMGEVAMLVAHRAIKSLGFDTYVLMASFALMSNVAPYLDETSFYVASRVVQCLQIIADRYQEVSADEEGDPDSSITGECLGTAVEMVAAIVFVDDGGSTTVRNHQLVLALLHKREDIFDADGGVMMYFLKNRSASTRCRVAQGKLLDLLNRIELTRLSLPYSRLSKDELSASMGGIISEGLSADERYHQRSEAFDGLLSQVKFTFEEDQMPEMFFVPYVWSVVVNYSPTLEFHLASARLPILINHNL